MSNSNTIILFEPLFLSNLIKVFIPYQMKQEREFFKRLSSAYYHPDEKLWSVLNSKGTFEELGRMFNGKYEIQKSEPNRGNVSMPTAPTDTKAKAYCLEEPKNKTINLKGETNEISLEQNWQKIGTRELFFSMSHNFLPSKRIRGPTSQNQAIAFKIEP